MMGPGTKRQSNTEDPHPTTANTATPSATGTTTHIQQQQLPKRQRLVPQYLLATARIGPEKVRLPERTGSSREEEEVTLEVQKETRALLEDESSFQEVGYDQKVKILNQDKDKTATSDNPEVKMEPDRPGSTREVQEEVPQRCSKEGPRWRSRVAAQRTLLPM